MKSRIGPPTYLVTLVALLALTAISYLVSGVELGAWHMPVALIIAAMKGSLVVLFFMHLAEQEISNRITLGVSVAFVAIMVILFVSDIWTRGTPAVSPPPASMTRPQASGGQH